MLLHTEAISNNVRIVPFVITIVVSYLFSTYMVFDPSQWIASFMQLTAMEGDFKIYILILGLGYLGLAWSSEHYFFPRVARYAGWLKTAITKSPKKRKLYKVVAEQIRTAL